MSAARGVARYLSGGTAIPLGFGEGAAPDLLALWAADAVLARTLRWPRAVFGCCARLPICAVSGTPTPWAPWEL